MASFVARAPRMSRTARSTRAARVSRAHGNPLLQPRLPEWRSRFVVAMVALGFVGLVARAGYLQLFSHDYLQRQGELRYGRTLELPASRGSIYDRNKVLLATSRPVRAIFAVPRNLQASPGQLEELARLLGMSQAALADRIADRDRQFVYLKRGVEIDVADQVMALRIRGISTLAEYTREYPIGERAAHLIGFTGYAGNGADGEQLQGRAGVERMFDDLLTGRPGSRRVIQDARGNFVEAVGDEQAPIDGKDVVLSIDNELQFHAYHAVREAAIANKAKAAAAVVVDVRTGEILALANWPSADPNQRESLDVSLLRNRAALDTFEPGSTIKPFTVAAALESGRFSPGSTIDTSPGHIKIGGWRIGDHGKDFGTLDLTGIVAKSSNVGTAKLALALTPERMGTMFSELGFGRAPALDLPGAAAGRVRPYRSWRPIEQATMSYGHGMSVSLLQLARAYTVFGRDGNIVPLTLVRQDSPQPGQQVMSAKTAKRVLGMLEAAVSDEGTARAARVAGYRVGGKTGTAYKVENGKYVRKYVSSFVGLAPISEPRYVIAAMIDEPGGRQHYGGIIAAPVFSQIAAQVLRHMHVTPDAEQPELVLPVANQPRGRAQ
jgi:cell division protein FtsI (penicillin-binding protein 3)